MVVLVDACSRLERELIRGWVDRSARSDVDLLDLRPSRRGPLFRRPRPTDPRLATRLQRGDDPWVQPVRVAWLPPERNGRRTASWIDLLKTGDPRDPNPVRQYLVLRFFPQRVRLVAGEGARASELVAAWQLSSETTPLADFVGRRAHLALERAERRLRGNRYKVPKFLKEEILSQSDFRAGVERIAREQRIPVDSALSRAGRYLREMAASHSTFLIDLVANAIHRLYSLGYGAIVYDPAELGKIASLGEGHPVVFLPSHRSMMDRLSLQYVLWENDLPPNHTAAGINMNFFPVGPLIRRTGAFFIRRSFKDDTLYKFVLRAYLDYLIEKRFPLEWYMEGGRSRSGKLLPPRFGMLNWVVDSVRRGKVEELHLIPTSIAYDQIQDVHDYAHEALGGEKRRESLTWAVSAIRSLRIGYGNIHIRFAEPISIRRESVVYSADEANLDLRKLAFEVMYRISQVTPITPTAVVASAVLAESDPSVDDVSRRCVELTRYITEQGLPTTEDLGLEDPDRVRRILNRLADHGNLTLEGERVRLTHRQAVEISYYRNTVVHFFVPGAMVELALASEEAPPLGEALALRDLLKFEFFFPARHRFVELIRGELARVDPGWEHHVETREGRRQLLERIRPLRAHWALLPFLEAYLVVAEELAEAGPSEEKRFLAACLHRGMAARREGRLRSPEAVSKALFKTALELVENRGLATPEERRAFAVLLGELRERALLIAALDAGRPTSDRPD